MTRTQARELAAHEAAALAEDPAPPPITELGAALTNITVSSDPETEEDYIRKREAYYDLPEYSGAKRVIVCSFIFFICRGTLINHFFILAFCT